MFKVGQKVRLCYMIPFYKDSIEVGDKGEVFYINPVSMVITIKFESGIFIDVSNRDMPQYFKLEEYKYSNCSCGKDKHNFTSHLHFCESYNEEYDGNGRM